MLIVPFTNIPYYLLLHITFSISLLVHWWNNSNVCSLSIFEAKLRGVEYTNSFTHKFIGPVYEISNTTWSKICYIVTIVLMILSAYKLWTSPAIKNAYYQVQKTQGFMPKMHVFLSLIHSG
jgi:hypothetical protein